MHCSCEHISDTHPSDCDELFTPDSFIIFPISTVLPRSPIYPQSSPHTELQLHTHTHTKFALAPDQLDTMHAMRADQKHRRISTIMGQVCHSQSHAADASSSTALTPIATSASPSPTHADATTNTKSVLTSPPPPPPSFVVPQSTNRVLMVRPLHFIRNEETALDNAFMQSSPLTPYEVRQRAWKEFERYVTLLRSYGIEVDIFEPSPHLQAPDGCYPNNWFSTHARQQETTTPPASRMILYPMKAYSRRLEREAPFISRLRRQYDSFIDLSCYESSSSFTSSSSSSPVGIFFEGTGSGIIDHIHRKLYYCRSERSHTRVAEKVVEAIWPNQSSELIPFDAHTSNGRPHYHTNVMMSIGTDWSVLCTDCMPNSEEVELAPF